MAIGDPTPCMTPTFDNSATTTRNLVASVNIPAGSDMIVCIGHGASVAVTVGMGSGPGGWATDKAQPFAGAVGWAVTICRARTASQINSGNAIGTATFSGAPLGANIAAFYSNGDALAVDDSDGSGTNTAVATWSAPAVDSTAAGFAIGGCLLDGNATNTATSGTEIADILNTFHDWAFAVQWATIAGAATPAATLAGTWTFGGAADKTTAVVAYKAAPVGPTTIVSPLLVSSAPSYAAHRAASY